MGHRFLHGHTRCTIRGRRIELGGEERIVVRHMVLFLVLLDGSVHLGVLHIG